jgi:HB1, ASXL, restriction endonuclease HTH domain
MVNSGGIWVSEHRTDEIERLLEERRNFHEANIKQHDKNRQIQITEINKNFDELIGIELRSLKKIEIALAAMKGVDSDSDEVTNPQDEGASLDTSDHESVTVGERVRKRKPGRKSSLKDKSVLAATHAVLDDAGDVFLEPAEVARRAILRGYRGRVYFDDPEKNAASFFDVLRRRSHLFLRDEQDRFRLRREGDPAPEGGTQQDIPEGSRAWMAEQILLDHNGGPMTATEITQEILAKKMDQGQGLRATRNALVTALDRHPRFERLEQGLYRLVPMASWERKEWESQSKDTNSESPGV